MSAQPETTLQTTSAERRWRAVQEHDATFDGQFVYAVQSTGIYCRPSCPSRRPSRELVRFFDAPEAASQAGYRPCKRCRPDGDSPQIELARRAAELIDESDERLTLAELGEALAVSPSHLQRVFKRVIGVSPREYAARSRTERVKERLRERDDVTSSLYEAGYGSSSRLYEQAASELGMTPGAYRRGGQGMAISYAVVDSPLGRLLVGWTERGVCAVMLGDDDQQLERDLYAEYPRAEISRDETTSPWLEQVLDYLAGDLQRLDLPLDLQPTAFRMRVWRELRQIPPGETRSYSEIAEAIGKPKAARAVANACAANPAALAIPCHRVVPAAGDSGGYRWGPDRKRWLLDHERSVAEVE